MTLTDELRALHDANRCDSVECERGFDCYWINALHRAAELALEAAASLVDEVGEGTDRRLGAVVKAIRALAPGRGER